MFSVAPSRSPNTVLRPSSDPAYLNDANESFSESTHGTSGNRLSFNGDAVNEWSLEELQGDVDRLAIDLGNNGGPTNC